MNWKNDRIGSALKGENPTAIARMKSGFAVMGDTQFLPGYCLLLAYPAAGCLNELTIRQRSDFLADMSIIGDAITVVCSPFRINYEILGNTDAFLHAHIFPRYEWEDETRRKTPVFLYPRENWSIGEYQFDEQKHGEMKKRLAAALIEIMGKAYR